MIYLRLFYEFFKTGLFSVGGGMATVPFLQNMAEKTGWFTQADLVDMIAIAESTPGAMGVNTATYVGFKTGMAVLGIPGALLGSVTATLGLVTPSVIVIIIIAGILDKFRKSKYVEAAFYGLRAASVGLIGAAGISVLLIAIFGIGSIYELGSAIVNPRQMVLAVLILFLTRWCKKTRKLHPIYMIALSAILGITFRFAV